MNSRVTAALVVTTLLSASALAKDAPATPTQNNQSEPGIALIQSPTGPKPRPKSPQTLRDAYLAALRRSDSVDIQRELLHQTNETVSQAYGSMAPTINGTAAFLHQQVPTASSNPAFLSDTTTTKLSADQPLFRGLRDFAALRQSKAMMLAQVFNLKNAAKQLFFDLTTAYYNVLAAEADQKNYEEEIEIYQKRVGELRHFIQVGRSKETDLLTFQTSMTALEATLELTKGQVQQAKDVLAYITGWDREAPLGDNEFPSTIPAEPEVVGSYLAQLENRPDVKSALNVAKGYSEGVPIARGAHFPNVDLLGDYYYDRPGQPEGQADWDIQLAITIPIFQGGIVNSQVRFAQSVATQYELQLSQTRRLAEQEIRSYFDSTQSDKLQLIKLEETVMWAKKNYDAMLRDYRNGLVTNLDVLTAINSYQDTQRSLDHMKMQFRSDQAHLQAASGQRPEIDVPTEKAQ